MPHEIVTSKNDKKTHFVSTAWDFGHSACYTKYPKFPQPKSALPFPTIQRKNFFKQMDREFPSLTLLAEEIPQSNPLETENLTANKRKTLPADSTTR
ncbi:hypothetical protein TNCV_3254011 [Trichonephila clavipes]|nr:hypothetical protein TNCV_3254011 [Trichonephila clavipes]